MGPVVLGNKIRFVKREREAKTLEKLSEKVQQY